MRLLPRTIWMLSVGGVVLILILAVFLFRSPEGGAQQKDISGTADPALVSVVQRALQESAVEDIRKDRDSDGLYDWEEKLWKTDPDNHDTDGDGTSDGLEVDQGRDPTVPGPNDAFSMTVSSKNTAGSPTDSVQTNATDIFAQEFFSDYMSLRQSGQLTEQAGQNFILQEALGNLPTIPAVYYSTEDFHVVSSTKETARAYGNAVGYIFLTSTYQGRNELEIINEALVEGNEEVLNELQKIIDAFDQTLDSLSLISVPRDIVATHVELLNNLSNVRASLVVFQSVYQDPLSAMSGLVTYRTSAERVVGALTFISSYLKNQGITYSEEEGGFLFSDTLP